MKLIIDLTYHGYVVDARYLEAFLEKNGPTTLKIDCSNIIDNEIAKATAAPASPPRPKKPIDPQPYPD